MLLADAERASLLTQTTIDSFVFFVIDTRFKNAWPFFFIFQYFIFMSGTALHEKCGAT